LARAESERGKGSFTKGGKVKFYFRKEVSPIGFTHYYRRPKEIPRDDMLKIIRDFKKMVPLLSELKVYLAGGNGEGEAEINIERIWFNGPEKCGHLKNEAISIPWPTDTAGGIAGFTEDAQKGNWFAGALIDKRCCDGDCSYETFHFPRVFKIREWDKPDEKGLYFDFCKTAFRPYDLAVNVFLIIAKHYLKDNIKVSSDGKMTHWQEGMMLCQVHLGYGLEFKLKD